MLCKEEHTFNLQIYKTNFKNLSIAISGLLSLTKNKTIENIFVNWNIAGIK